MLSEVFNERISEPVELSALRGVRRACYAGLDSAALRREVMRRAAPVLGGEAWMIAGTNPDTGLATHVVSEGMPPEMAQRYLDEIYPEYEAERTTAPARDRVVSSMRTARPDAPAGLYSPEFAQLMREHGFAAELRAVLVAEGRQWGVWYEMREADSPAFGTHERRFLRAIIPHLARGLELAALSRRAMAGRDADVGNAAPPVVIALDERGRVTVHSDEAARLAADLADEGAGRTSSGEMPIPPAIASALEQLAALHARGVPEPTEEPLASEVRTRGHSGRWYRLRASLAEPDARGEYVTTVIAEPVVHGETAPALARRYGLSPREREIVAGRARGLSTREIAARLGMAPERARDDLDRASDKMGARGRHTLVTRLVRDDYERGAGAGRAR